MTTIDSANNRRERGVLFGDAMVRAILDGAKTQTRRALKTREPLDFIGPGGPHGPNKDDPECWGWLFDGPAHHGYMVVARGKNERHDHGLVSIPCPYGDVGDRLWVREAWAPFYAPGSGLAYPEPDLHEANAIRYRATPDHVHAYPTSRSTWTTRPTTRREHVWRPSIFLPRWASRIALEVAVVRAERLHDLTEADALAEGIREVTKDGVVRKFCVYDHVDCSSTPWAEMPRTARDAYAALWDSINGAGAWAKNPWVWAITFKRIGAARDAA